MHYHLLPQDQEQMHRLFQAICDSKNDINMSVIKQYSKLEDYVASASQLSNGQNKCMYNNDDG